MKTMQANIGELPTFALSLFSFAFFLFPLLLIAYLSHGFSLSQFTTARKKIDFNRFFFSFGLFGSVSIISFLIEYLIYPSLFTWNFQPMPFLVLVLISIFLFPIQIGFEEYFFRGYFMQWLGLLSRNRWIPLFLSSILFGLVHIANPEVQKMGYEILFFYIGMGFLLGIVTLMDDGLELALGIHFANNLVISLLSTAEWTVLKTPSLFKQTEFIPINFYSILMQYLLYILVIFVLARKYNWKNWKNKLFGKLPI